jgi:hypothetical protein
MASAPQVEMPPQALPGGMRRSPTHASSAADGWQVHLAALALMQVQPAGQQVPAYCPSLGGYGLPAAGAAGGEVPPHWSHGLSSAPAGQLVGASQTVLLSLSLTTRLPSTTCGEAAGRQAHGTAGQFAFVLDTWRLVPAAGPGWQCWRVGKSVTQRLQAVERGGWPVEGPTAPGSCSSPCLQDVGRHAYPPRLGG